MSNQDLYFQFKIKKKEIKYSSQLYSVLYIKATSIPSNIVYIKISLFENSHKTLHVT